MTLRYNTEKLQNLYDIVKDRTDNRNHYESDSYAKFLTALARAEKWLKITKTLLPVINDTNDIYKELKERSEEHTSELQSRQYLVCRLLLEKKKNKNNESS